MSAKRPWLAADFIQKLIRCSLILLFTVQSFSYSNRNRGNSQRNYITKTFDTADEYRKAYLRSERGPGPEEGRSLDLVANTETFPWVSVARSTMDSTQIALSFRLGLLSVIEYVEQDNVTGISGGDLLVRAKYFQNSAYPTFLPWTESSGFRDDAAYYIYRTQTPHGTVSVKVALADIRSWISGEVNQTLAPNCWKWEVNVKNFTYSRNQTRLALKFILASQTSPKSAGIVPASQSDDPGFTLSDIHILVPSNDDPHFKERNRTVSITTYDESDLGYISWATSATVLREVKSRPATVPVHCSGVMEVDQDYAAFSEPPNSFYFPFDSSSEDHDFHKHFFYLSFDAPTLYSINFQMFTGVDETDFEEVSAASALHRSNTLLFVIGFLLLCFCIF